jgi:cytoskeletal protein RodZ
MYEQSEVPVIRRILWAVATFAIIFLVLWGIVWVLFLRHSTPVSKPKTTTGSSQSQKQTHSSGSSSTTDHSNTSSDTSNTGTTTPTELVNTGAGDVLGLFVAVTVVAGIAYQIRLRTRLTV